ncbi:hypothetical protein U9M48_015795, partial [Paspalum notatum var. saurae]
KKPFYISQRRPHQPRLSLPSHPPGHSYAARLSARPRAVSPLGAAARPPPLLPCCSSPSATRAFSSAPLCRHTAPPPPRPGAATPGLLRGPFAGCRWDSHSLIAPPPTPSLAKSATAGLLVPASLASAAYSSAASFSRFGGAAELPLPLLFDGPFAGDEHPRGHSMSSSSNGHYPAIGAKVLHKREKNKEKIQLDKNAASRACQKDRQYIEKLETELMNCYQEIDYLQDQLSIRNVEANIMGEHIHSLELKLTELEKFPERVKIMDNELIRSDSQCWLLMEEVRCKEEELQKATSQIEKLESTALDSQCEIESLKLELTNLEQRLFDAESIAQRAAEHKARIDKLLGEHELQLHESQKTIDKLVLENNQLKELLPVRSPKQSTSTSGEQLEKTSENAGHAGYERKNVILERMAKQNDESELLIEQLKEELRDQKLKAKEDAEDLTQEMAELRYQITGMLEEEYKRRSCIEQAAIQHIQELETQVSNEKAKLSGALRRLQESHELAHTQAMEIKKLKDALERFNSAVNGGTVCSCGFCAMLIKLSNCSIEGPSGARPSSSNHIDEKLQNQVLIEWQRPDGDAGFTDTQRSFTDSIKIALQGNEKGK